MHYKIIQYCCLFFQRGKCCTAKFRGCHSKNKFPSGIKKHVRMHSDDPSLPLQFVWISRMHSSFLETAHGAPLHKSSTEMCRPRLWIQYKDPGVSESYMHVRWSHNRASHLRCKIEGREFVTKTKSNLKAPFLSRHDERRRNDQCPMCAQKFFTDITLPSYLRTHTNEKPWQCSLCPYEGEVQLRLTKHVEAAQWRTKKFEKGWAWV